MSRSAADGGQSLVEFSLILMPLFLILLGIIQFGFIFNTYIAMSSAVRDGARAGTVFVYRRDCSKDQNDALRNETIRSAVVAAMTPLNDGAPRFVTARPVSTSSDRCALSDVWTRSDLTFTNGDLTITYLVPVGVDDSQPRTGQQVTVDARYHQDIIIPLIGNLLPRDDAGRLRIGGAVTMSLE